MLLSSSSSKSSSSSASKPLSLLSSSSSYPANSFKVLVTNHLSGNSLLSFLFGRRLPHAFTMKQVISFFTFFPYFLIYLVLTFFKEYQMLLESHTAPSLHFCCNLLKNSTNIFIRLSLPIWLSSSCKLPTSTPFHLFSPSSIIPFAPPPPFPLTYRTSFPSFPVSLYFSVTNHQLDRPSFISSPLSLYLSLFHSPSFTSSLFPSDCRLLTFFSPFYLENLEPTFPIANLLVRCVLASLKEVVSVRPSVRPSVRRSHSS